MYISEDILRDFQRGNIAPLYQHLFPSLQRYAERVLGTDFAYLAEDCIQEAIFNVYQQRKEFHDPSHMRTFLFTCVHNEVISLLRKQNSRQQYLQQPQERFEDTLLDNLVLQETLDRLYAAIDQLPDTLRQVFDMSFEQGLQNKEIASQLQLSPETIKKRKAKLISLLRQKLKGDEHAFMLVVMIGMLTEG